MRHITKTTTTGTLDGFTTATVKPENMAHMMKVASTQYGRKEDAVLRELATNGYDAHIEAGTTASVEVTLPTLDHPQVTIRDTGIGMSAQTMTEVYRNYYSSTKRDAHEEEEDDTPVIRVHGSLGIGSKSPYAVSSQFYVISNHNGVKITMLFIKQTGGLPGSKIISEEPTDEPNGLTVVVPVSYEHLDLWIEAAQRVFFWWEPNTVKVTQGANDVTPPSYRDFVNTEYSSDHVLMLDLSGEDRFHDVIRQQYHHRVTMLMGSINYDIPSAALPDRMNYSTPGTIVYRASLNDGLPYTPSRESMEDTQALRDALETWTWHWTETFNTVIQQQIDNAKTTHDLMTIKAHLPPKLHTLSTIHINHDTLRQRDLPIYLGHTSYRPTEPNDPRFPLDPPMFATYYDGNPRKQERPYTRIIINERPTFLRRDMSDADMRILQRWRREYHYPELTIIPEDIVLEPFMTADDANWLDWDTLVAETPPPPKPKKQTNSALRVYEQYPPQSRRSGPSQELKASQIKASITPNTIVVAGSSAHYEDHMGAYFAARVIHQAVENLPKSSLDAVEPLFLAKGNRNLSTLEKLLDQPVYTPQDYATFLKHRAVTALPAKQRRLIGDAGAIHSADQLRILSERKELYNDATQQMISTMVDVLRQVDQYPPAIRNLADHPDIPSSRLQETYPTALQLLRHINAFKPIEPSVLDAIVAHDLATPPHTTTAKDTGSCNTP